MSTLLSQDSSMCHQGQNKSPGILLNNLSIPAPYLDPPIPRHRQLSTSEASSSSSTSNSRSRSPRRIRFAPLPEPRRIDDTIPNSPFYDSDSDAPSPSPPTPPDYPPSPRFSVSALTPDEQAPKAKLKSWGQKFLAPFLKQSSPDSNSPLFRTASHDVSAEPKYMGGASLTRRMSTPAERTSTGEPPTPEYTKLSGSKGSNTTRSTRMLNGHVYGRRHNSSLSSQTTPNYEPEFIEWGYGGMGSVNAEHASKPGTDWAKLQHRGKVLGGDDPDDDDGSGMGWVKKRREQREREKSAREEMEQSSGVPEIAVHPPPEGSRKDSSQETARDNNIELEHHVYEAVSVPAPPHSPHRRRDLHQANPKAAADDNAASTLSRNSSVTATPSRTSSHNSTLWRALYNDSATQSALHPPPPSDVSSTSSFTSTSTSSADEEDEEEEDTERESDEEADEETEGRITSKCAGVEKVSRHANSME